MTRRFFQVILRGGAQGVPVAGIVAAGWSPAGGLILYWVESVLILLATAILLELWARRGASPKEIERAGIRTRDVLTVHGGAFGIFGLFLAAILFIFTNKGYLTVEGILAASAGLPWIAAIVGVEFAIDLARLRGASAADLARRVDAGTRRFLLFWLTGFVGGWVMVFSGRPLLLFSIFAAFKIVVEAGALFSRGISMHPSTQAAAQSPAKSAARAPARRIRRGVRQRAPVVACPPRRRGINS